MPGGAVGLWGVIAARGAGAGLAAPCLRDVACWKMRFHFWPWLLKAWIS